MKYIEMEWLSSMIPRGTERPTPPPYTHYIKGNGQRVQILRVIKEYRGSVQVENVKGDIVDVAHDKLVRRAGAR